jgi:hypothetical protein
MKEDIVQYKGKNPLIGVPASLTVVACVIFVFALAAAFYPESGRGWEGTFIVFMIYAGCYAALIAIGFVIKHLDDEPCIIYASRRAVRATVMFASFAGIAFLLLILAASQKPDFSTTLSSACYALSILGTILLLAHIFFAISSEVSAKAKPCRTKQPACFIFSHLTGSVACVCLGIYRHSLKTFSVETGESLFLLFTVGAIAFLWFEDEKAGIADREIIPLSTASILWIGSALAANYAYGTLASVTFILPYLVYFLPLILLGFYYYVSAPEES